MITFSRTTTLNTEERKMLGKAITVSDITLGEILEQVDDNQGTLYLAHDKEALMAVIYFQQYGNTLTIRALGGVEFKNWCIELQEFIISLLREHKIPRFQILARYGWHKYCPKLKFEGCLYSYGIGGGLQPSS